MRRLLLFLFLLSSSTVVAQNYWEDELFKKDFDYPSYPIINLDYIRADVNLEINPETGVVKGNVAYESISLVNGLTEIILNSLETSVESIVSNRESLDFRVQSDSLIVALGDTLQKGDSFNFEITWQSESKFGYYRNNEGYLWTSSQPLSNRHWIPGLDHPRNELQVQATFSIPQSQTVIGNGDLNSDEMLLDSDKRVMVWETNSDISFTSISWMLGSFEMEEVISGIKKIRLFKKPGDDIESSDLLSYSAAQVREIENKLGKEYPFSAINLILFDDTYDQIQNYASTIFLAADEDWKDQIDEGIIKQWFGVQKRPLNESESYTAFNLLQNILKYTISEDLADKPILNSTNPEILFDELQAFIYRLDSDPAVLTWFDIASDIYKVSGQPYFDFPSFSLPDEVIEEESGLTFTLEYDFDDIEGYLNLIFSSTNNAEDTLHSAVLTEFVFGDTLRTDITFTGELDTVRLEVNQALDYAIVEPLDEDLTLREIKPLSFLLAQLRSADPSQRIHAANGLASYANEPDLQLAIQDILNNETNDEVKAALLASQVLITGSAFGTESNYLQELNSGNKALELTALSALQNFEGNEEVVQAISSKVIRAEDEEVFEKAVESLLVVADSTVLVQTQDRLTSRTEDINRVFHLLEWLPVYASDSAFVERALPLTGSENEARTRIKAFNLLSQIEGSFWTSIIRDWLGDSNPNIRLEATKNLDLLDEELRESTIQELELSEYDYRVLKPLFDIKKADEDTSAFETESELEN